MTLTPKNLPKLLRILRCYKGHHRVIPHQFHSIDNALFYSFPPRRSVFTHNKESFVKLKEEKLTVNPSFGVLHVTGTTDFHIKPTDVQQYPDADRAFVRVHGSPFSEQACVGVIVELTGEQKDILSVCVAPPHPHSPSAIFCEVEVPVKYDLDIKLMEEGGVRISGMESDEVKVSTESGEMNSRGLKSHNIHITTQDGHITSDGSLQGNIFIKAKNTYLKAKRLQGLALDIEAKELRTDIGSSYMSQGQIKTDKGDVKINNLHGCTDLLIKEGQLVINGFHGQISGFVGSGNVEMQVTDVKGNSTLHLKEGTMKLSVLETPRHDMEVSAPNVCLSEEVKKIGTIDTQDNDNNNKQQVFTLTNTDQEDASTIKAKVVTGRAEVACQNWFSTLGIKLPR